MVKQLSEAYLNRIRRVLQLQKFYQIEKLRQQVRKADAESANGTCPDLAEKFHIFGNTANTYIDIVQKNSLKQIEDKNQVSKRHSKVENLSKKTKKGVNQLVQNSEQVYHQEETVEIEVNIRKIEIP